MPEPFKYDTPDKKRTEIKDGASHTLVEAEAQALTAPENTVEGKALPGSAQSVESVSAPGEEGRNEQILGRAADIAPEEVQSLGHGAELNIDGSESMLDPEQHNFTNEQAATPPILRLRKPRRRRIPVSILVSLLPLLALLVSLIVDRAAFPCFMAKLIDATSPVAIADYSMALQQRRDIETLNDRSLAYARFKKWDKAAQDLQELVDHGVRSANIYRRLASLRVAQDGASPGAIQLLHKAMDLSDAHSQNASVYFPDEDSNLVASTYDLLNLGDYDTVLNVSKEKSVAYTDCDEMQVINGLVLRELGRDKESQAVLGDIYSRGLYYPITTSDYYSFMAMTDLDHSDTAAAQAHLKEGASAKGGGSRQLRDLTMAWMLYQKGKLSQALKKSSTVDNYYEQWDGSGILSLQAGAARHLLRAHIYYAQNNPDRAREEMAAYKEDKLSGAIFIPKPYRSWIKTAF